MSSSVAAVVAIGDEGTLEIPPHPTPGGFTPDFWVARVFIIVSVRVQIHVWVTYC